MNTIGSVYYGWAWLIVCGGGSYYFAKRSINADRADRQAQDLERRRLQNRQMAANTHKKASDLLPSKGGATKGVKPPESSKQKLGEEAAHTPSGEASSDPAPAGGQGQGDGQVGLGLGLGMESKFEARSPYRSQKGDRFS